MDRRFGTTIASGVLDEKYVLQEARGDVASHPAYRRYHYAYGPLSVTDAAGTRFIGTDALGSPTDLTTTTGAVAAAHQYDAWGQYRNGTAPSAEEPKLGYTGHQYDPETGLVYARARYYDPEIGIFISRDSYEGELEDGPSLHRYAYAYGNPVIYADQDGHSATAVGTALGFAWGLGQAIGGVFSGNVEDVGDFLSVVAQNTIGGAEIGAGIDITVASGGLLATSAGGAFGFAGFDALTFDGKAKGWKDFGVSQVIEGGKGAVLGPAFGTAFKFGGTALRWVGGTGAGQWTAQVGKEAIGKLASTRVGQAVAQFATKAGERVAGTARAAGGWLGREGAALDAAAAEVGLGKAVQAPKALGQALGNLENRATQAAAGWFRPAAPERGPLLLPARGETTPSVLLDTNVMIDAAEKGNKAALAAIRSSAPEVPTSVASEFLVNVQTHAQRTARMQFMRDEGIRLLPRSEAAALRATPEFQQVYSTAVRAGHSVADAELAAFARASGREALTAERRLANLFNETHKKLGVRIRRVR